MVTLISKFQLDHVGIAVNSLSDANKVFSLILGEQPKKIAHVESEKVTTSFFIANSKIELLEPSSRESIIQKFLDKKGPGVHHIAIKVSDFEERIEVLKKNNMQLVPDQPFIGAEGCPVIFVHPKSTGGVLIELVKEC